MRNINAVFPQWEYDRLRAVQANWVADQFRKGLEPGDSQKLDKFALRPNPRTHDEFHQVANTDTAVRAYLARKTLSKMIADQELRKAGVTSALGFNFYDLRAPAYLLYPVNTPMRNQLPREGPVNAGTGIMANWKASRSPGIQPFSVPEGQRASKATPDEIDYAGKYTEGGVERGVTFTAQFAGEGYTDVLADEHLRGLHELWLGEEGTIWMGNGGSGSVGVNGFALTQAPTPTLAATAAAAGTFTTGQYISVAVVLITGMGYPANAQYGYGVTHSVTAGLTPTYRVTGGDGGSYPMPGGISAISALSATQAATTTSGNAIVATLSAAQMAAKKGAFAYAWFVDVEASNIQSLANAKLYAITTVPTCTITASPSGNAQPATSLGLDTDYSANPLEFTGLIPMVAATPGAVWTDLRGASLSSSGHGAVDQVETILENNFAVNQCGYSDIWGSPDAIFNLSKAILASGSATTGFQFMTTRDSQNNILGGYVVSGYVSRYAVNSPTGANVIPLRMHPMIPPGTLYFDIATNPYPHSRLGNPRAMLVQRDYYGIEWPVTTREWTWGTYVHEVLAHRLPWIPAVLAGIGAYTGA